MEVTRNSDESATRHIVHPYVEIREQGEAASVVEDRDVSGSKHKIQRTGSAHREQAWTQEHIEKMFCRRLFDTAMRKKQTWKIRVQR